MTFRAQCKPHHLPHLECTSGKEKIKIAAPCWGSASYTGQCGPSGRRICTGYGTIRGHTNWRSVKSPTAWTIRRLDNSRHIGLHSEFYGELGLDTRCKCETPSKRRTDGQTRTPTTSTAIAAVTPYQRRCEPATRRPCQDTNGRTNGRTDGQTPGIEFCAF